MPLPILHLLGVSLLADRGLHAFGVSREPKDLRFRVTGMGMTLTTIGATAFLAIGAAFVHRFA